MHALPPPRRMRGRPRKFAGPSRAVTVTLPEDVLIRLRAMDADLGRAIVAAVERKGASRVPLIRPAELANYGKHAVIVVTPLKALQRLPGVQLVPVANGRCLIALQHSYSTPRLELDIRDALERKDGNSSERDALEAIADILRRARGNRDVSLEERTIIVFESKRTRRSG
jgi:hypothetical protein